jgi:hypothetical protein
MIAIGQSSNAPTATPYGALEFSNVYANNLAWNYVESRTPSGPPIEFQLHVAPDYTAFPAGYTNAQALFQAAAGTDGGTFNVGNVVAAPVAAPGSLSLGQNPSATFGSPAPPNKGR